MATRCQSLCFSKSAFSGCGDKACLPKHIFDELRRLLKAQGMKHVGCEVLVFKPNSNEFWTRFPSPQSEAVLKNTSQT